MRLVLKDAASGTRDGFPRNSHWAIGALCLLRKARLKWEKSYGGPNRTNSILYKDTYSNPFFERIAQYRASASKAAGRKVRILPSTKGCLVFPLCSMCSGGSMAERAAVNRLTKVRFLPGARQDASSKSLGLTACIGVGTGFRTYVGSIPTKPNAS